MMKPIGNKILVELDEIEKETKCGIFLIETVRDKATAFGTIKAVGSLVEKLRPGQRIVFDQYAGTDLKIEGKKHVVMKDFNVMGFLE